MRLPIEVLRETPIGAVQQGRVEDAAVTGAELAERIAADYPTFERRARAILRANPELGSAVDDADIGDVLHNVWVTLRTREAGLSVRDPYAYFALSIDHAARDHSRRGRQAVSLDGVLSSTTGAAKALAPEKTPEEAAEEREERDRLLDVLASLPDEARAAFVFRVGFGLKPRAIAQVLQISPRRYRKQRDIAAKLLEQRAHERASGAVCDELRPLIPKYVRAVLEGTRSRQVRAHLHACGGCRAALQEVRSDANRLAAAVPLPAVLLGTGATVRPSGMLERVAEAAGEVRQQVTDAVSAGKQHAYSLAARGSDPTPLGGARPGAAVAIVSACIAGGGAAAYCVEQGVPEPLRDAAQAITPGGDDRKKPQPVERTPPASHPDPVAVELVSESQPNQGATPSQEPAVAPQPAPAPPPTRAVQEEQEFGFEQTAPAQSSAAAPAPAPAPRPAAPAAGQEFGFER